jgi:hypothetical protein
MFNRIRPGNFLTCFVAGVLIGINTTRNGENSNLELINVTMPFMALYAGLRFPGDFDQRTNRTVGLVLGVLVGAYSARNLRTIIAPPALPIRP